jgi:hypothetical protein
LLEKDPTLNGFRSEGVEVIGNHGYYSEIAVLRIRLHYDATGQPPTESTAYHIDAAIAAIAADMRHFTRLSSEPLVRTGRNSITGTRY